MKWCMLSIIGVLLLATVSIADEETRRGPSLEVLNGVPVGLKATKVKAEVAGVIAKIDLTQVYKNQGDRAAEVIYLFPLSTKAALHDMAITVEGRVIKATLSEREKARVTYAEALTQGRTAALLEAERPNVLTMRVGNVLPGDEVEVMLTYSEILEREGSTLSFVLPTVVGPRYQSPQQSNPLSLARYLSYRNSDELDSDFNFEMRVRGPTAVREVNSPSHSVAIERVSDHESVVRYHSQQPDKDLIVHYSLAGGDIESGSLLHRDLEENFFLLTVEPPALPERRRVVPRNYTFILDVSGSMGGFPLETAKQVVSEVIDFLHPHDYFNILLFSGGSREFSSSPVAAHREEKERAIRLLSTQEASGGTELLPALRRALTFSKMDDLAHSAVLLTDGYVTVERETFELVRENLGSMNLFTFGIGTSVNRFLLEGLSHIGQTPPIVVDSPQGAKDAVRRFTEIVEAPLLRDIKVSFDLDAYDVEPASIPTLYQGRPVTIVGKCRTECRGTIRLEGISSEGKISRSIAVSPESGARNPALPVLWAQKRLQVLSNYNGVRGVKQEADAIIALSLQYKILTELTSFVGVDTVQRTNEGYPRTTLVQPVPLPSGVTSQGPGLLDRLFGGGHSSFGYAQQAVYEDDRVAESLDLALLHITGRSGALIMYLSGLLALGMGVIAFRTRRTRYYLCCSVFLLSMTGTYLLRSAVSHMLNDTSSLIRAAEE